MIEKTLAIIKPDAIKKKVSGKIIDRIEQENFNIIGLKKLHLTEEQAEKFYQLYLEKYPDNVKAEKAKEFLSSIKANDSN